MFNKEVKSVFDLKKAFPDEQTCIEHLEVIRWNGNVVSPFDATSKVYKCRGNKYQCKNTNRYFNVKTDTLFDNTKMPLQKWFLAIFLITSHKEGISSLQLGRDLNITQKSAWFLLQRIRACFGIENNNQLESEVEIDETFIGGSDKNRHANKKKKGGQGGTQHTSVLGMVERLGEVNTMKVKNRQSTTIIPQILDVVSEEATVYTNEFKGCRSLNKVYNPSVVKRKAHEYVKDRIHTNTIEGFCTLLKRRILEIYHFTSEKRIQKYVDEFVFRYYIRSISTSNRIDLMFSNMTNRLTYKELIG